MSVQIIEDEERGVLIARLEGRLDAASSPLVEQKITSFIDAGHRKLLLSFEQVDYLSSAGMRVLLTLSKKLQSLKGKMVLACVKADVMEVVRMAGFDRILEIRNTEREALSAL